MIFQFSRQTFFCLPLLIFQFARPKYFGLPAALLKYRMQREKFQRKLGRHLVVIYFSPHTLWLPNSVTKSMGRKVEDKGLLGLKGLNSKKPGGHPNLLGERSGCERSDRTIRERFQNRIKIFISKYFYIKYWGEK